MGEPYSARKIFNPLIDSPELVKDYFADLYSLSSIEDYKPLIIRLMAAMSDKGLLKPEQYKDKLPALLLDTRNEYKRREKSSGNYRDYEDEDNSQSLLSSYNKLLLPFIDVNTGVKNLIDKMLRQGSEDLKIDLVSALLKKGKAVPDSIINPLASDQLSRLSLYYNMFVDSVADKFPVKYSVPDSFAYSIVVQNYIGRNTGEEEKAKDSIVMLDKKVVQLFDEVGMAYFFKVKTGKSKFWKTEIVGLQPQDSAKHLHTYNQLTAK